MWDGEDVITVGPLHDQTHVAVSPYENSVFWATYNAEIDEFRAWVFRFSGEGFIFPLKTVLGRCQFESRRKEELEKAVKEEDDRAWMANCYSNSRDVDMLQGDEMADIEDMELE